MPPKRKRSTATVATKSKRSRTTTTKARAAEKQPIALEIAVEKKSRKKVKSTKDSEPKVPGFLRIPPELRDRIYEEALVDGDARRTWIGHRIYEPPLLLTCRQIRDEARPMWYLQNRFAITVTHCNAKYLINFVNRIDSISADAECDLLVDIDGVIHKENMLKWCQAVHENKGVDAVEGHRGAQSTRERIIFRALRAAEEYRSLSWDECLERLAVVLSNV